MILVEGGSFIMGDHYNEGNEDELPLHNVNLDSFLISKYEITQHQFKSVLGFNPAHNRKKNYPVETINFFEIIKFCNALSFEEGLIPHYSIAGQTHPDSLQYEVEYIGGGYYKISELEFDWLANGYRLPTEAEWEYAARGGIFNSDNFRFSGCHTDEELPDFAWYGSDQGIKEVGRKNPNQIGLYDMTGNVWEICHDGYSADYYSISPENNPTGPDPESHLVMRGGDFLTDYLNCRVARRAMYFIEPTYMGQPVGFRIARSLNSVK